MKGWRFESGGFKTPHRINSIFSKIVHEMADAGEIDLTSPYPSLHKQYDVGFQIRYTPFSRFRR